MTIELWPEKYDVLRLVKNILQDVGHAACKVEILKTRGGDQPDNNIGTPESTQVLHDLRIPPSQLTIVL